MSLHYILDGYNIAHKITSLQTGSIQQSRDRLLRYIRTKHPQGSIKNKVTVVFDGNADIVDQPQNEHSIEVIFTHNVSADDHIIHLIKKSTNPKIIVVVSDDREVQNRAITLGAKIVEVKDFLMPYKKSGRTDPHGRTGSLDPVIKADKIALSLVELREIEKELLNKIQIQ